MATIYISIGSNIDRTQHIRRGLDALQRAFGTLRLSSVYESEAVGFDGSHFYNLVAEAQTQLSPASVEQIFKEIERDNGRCKGSKKFAPRTLDLDLLLYDDVISEEEVILPREEILYNAFVLQPLAEIAPELKHPKVQKTYKVLWSEYDKSSQSLWTVNFKWEPN